MIDSMQVLFRVFFRPFDKRFWYFIYGFFIFRVSSTSHKFDVQQRGYKIGAKAICSSILDFKDSAIMEFKYENV